MAPAGKDTGFKCFTTMTAGFNAHPEYHLVAIPHRCRLGYIDIEDLRGILTDPKAQ